MRVLLGVSGGIAAFKAAELIRRLRERGHAVRCALTPAAARFVSPLTLEVLSGHAVYGEEYLEANGSGEELHITAAAWAEVAVVAPATAHLVARLSLGLADDFLTTTLMAFGGPLVLAPAMHSQMWAKAPIAEHLARLAARGVQTVGPVRGPLASGEIGWGRMAEPEEIVAALEATAQPRDLAGRKVIVSAGPTFEPLDPVRFLGNRSSGKMGFALAAEAARRGADTLLVAGPVHLATPPAVRRVDVETALQMAEAIAAEAATADVIVMAAAVADYRPRERAAAKLKKSKQRLEAIALAENPDILAGLAEVAPQALRVGFAAETEELAEAGEVKLAAKRAHLIVANDVGRSDIGFGSDDNEATVFRRGRSPLPLSRQSKRELARRLLDLVAEELASREPASEPRAD